jgi:cytochrome c oxidase subunit II
MCKQMNRKKNKHKWIATFLHSSFLSLFLVGVLPWQAAFAQTTENIHQIDKTGESQTHAVGTNRPGRSFIERYAPPEVISSYGDDVEWLFRYTSWAGFAYFVVLAFALGYLSWRYRERQGHKAFYTHGYNKGEKATTLWLDVLFFVTLDIVLIAFTFIHAKAFLWKLPDSNDPQVVKVQVMPQQWVWNFRYAGEDGIFHTADDIITTNELVVPKGRKIYTQLMSRDVIHGFFIPNVRLQIDAIPGVVTKFWFDANKTGEYEIVCAHLCGTAHYKMKGFLKVLENDDYEAWHKENSEWAEAKYDPEDKLLQWGWNWGL